MTQVRRVYSAHTINTVALSIIGVYVPAYLLSLGYPLSQVILFYVISHGVGLLFGLFIFVPLVQRWGLLNTFKIYYPLQIIYLFLLSLLKTHQVMPEVVAIVNGLATFAYWIPLNIFMIKNSQSQEMGNNLSKFFALPNLFGILGPIIGAILIPVVGFWPVFLITAIGLVLSYLPLAAIKDKEMKVTLNFSKALKRLARNKTLFVFEFLDNIIEESEWFWSIYVFLIIGSLVTPGIVGSLQAIGGSIFTLLIGKYANKHSKKLIPLAAFLLLLFTVIKIFITAPISAYVVTLIVSFILNFFLVVYFSTIYKTIKNDKEEEFMILREIPTVLGRMVVFGIIYLTLPYLKFFFLLPIVIIILLLFLYISKRKFLLE
jgi:MFS family permease